MPSQVNVRIIEIEYKLPVFKLLGERTSQSENE